MSESVLTNLKVDRELKEAFAVRSPNRMGVSQAPREAIDQYEEVNDRVAAR